MDISEYTGLQEVLLSPLQCCERVSLDDLMKQSHEEDATEEYS